MTTDSTPLSGSLSLSTPAFAAQDLNLVKTTLDGIGLSSDKVAKSLTSAFAGAIVSGKSFDDTLKTITASLAKMVLNAGTQPLTTGLSSLLSSSFSGMSNQVTPFAEGGIVSQPTFFGSGGARGLMGEKGAEAIMPLSRGPDGRLGIAASGGGGRAVSINVSIATPDAESFRRSEAQVTGALARAVARGQRSL